MPRVCSPEPARGVPLQLCGDLIVEELQPGGVDPPSRLDDEGHEVTLVAVLRRLDAAEHCCRETRGQVRPFLEQAPRTRAQHSSTMN